MADHHQGSSSQMCSWRASWHRGPLRPTPSFWQDSSALFWLWLPPRWVPSSLLCTADMDVEGVLPSMLRCCCFSSSLTYRVLPMGTSLPTEHWTSTSSPYSVAHHHHGSIASASLQSARSPRSRILLSQGSPWVVTLIQTSQFHSVKLGAKLSSVFSMHFSSI